MPSAEHCAPITSAPSLAQTDGGHPVVALIGPANSGKTTLFNRLTGLRQKVANYPGVTVEKHVGVARLGGGVEIEVVDLPGVSGFSARSADERITRDALLGRIEGLSAPSGIVLIVDATRLETQLLLVEPVLAREVPTLLVLNMADELEGGGGKLDDATLAEKLGVQVVRTDARSGRGLEEVASFLRGIRVAGPGAAGEREPTRRLELPLLQLLSMRRERVRAALKAASYSSSGPGPLTDRLDALFLHRFLGPATFLMLAALVFQAIFTWAAPLMDGVDFAIAGSGEWIASRLPESWFRSLLIDGIWSGVGAVLVFLPQILILSLFLGILEDSGYMARAAVIADRLMMRVGLQGRAFLPLLSAYACAVPAILSSRTVESERDRLATMFIAPFMTCSARLPVYALLIAAFVPAQPVLGPLLGTQALTLLGLYGLGTLAAIGTSFILRRTVLRGRRSAFVLELPPYRIPSVRGTALRLLDRTKVFVRRVGKIILLTTIVLWALAQFPQVNGEPPIVEESALGQVGKVIEPAIAPLGYDWKIGVGLVSSLAAREVIVGTLGTIYGVENSEEDSIELRAALQQDLDLGAAVGLLIFFAFALQCMSTVGIMRRETGGWRWPLAQWGFMLVLAYVGAFVANQVL